MLFQCPCSRLIRIPTSYFFLLTTTELNELCLDDYGHCVNDPFYGSNMDKNSEEEHEEKEETLDDINYQEPEEDETAEMNE